MYKDVVKKILVGFLTICMAAGMIDLSAFTVKAAGGIFEDDGEINWHFDYPQSVIYDGSQQTPDVAIHPISTDGSYGTPLAEGTDYTVSYGENTNVGRGTIHLTGRGSYAGSDVTLYFNIRQKNMASPDITVETIPPQSYTGAAVVPRIIVKDGGRELDGVPLENAATGTAYDYTYTCSNNVNPGTATVNITGGRNYTGNKSATFTIVQLNSDLLTVEGVRARIPYTGEEIRPEPTVEYDGTLLTKGEDYTLSWQDNRVAGTATIYITGIGAYAGIAKTVEFTIVKPIGHADISVQPIGNQIYTGASIELDPGSLVIIDSDKPGEPLVAGRDFQIVNHQDNIAIGMAEVAIQGMGVYSSTRLEYFAITSATMNDVEIAVAECTYDGTRQEPAVTVSRGDIIYGGSDYNTSYWNNTAAGENAGIVAISGTGSLSGSVEKRFTINRRPLEDSNVTMTLDYPLREQYNGLPIEPEVTLKYRQGNGEQVTLQENRDYRLVYENSTNAGNATVTATGIGNFTGTKSMGYVIDPAYLNSAVIDDIAARTYNGMPQTPGIRVTVNGNLLSRYNEETGTGDYVATYTENTNAGTATVTVTGRGNYTGTADKTFEIRKKDISTSGVTVAGIPIQTYNGVELNPEVTVRYNGMTLNESRTDYTLEYGGRETNINAGTNTGVVVIKGTGNYEGEVRKNFSIAPRNLGSGDFLSLRNLEDVYSYTGEEIKAVDLEVYYNNPAAGMDIMLSPEDDYDVIYQTNTEIGTAMLKVNGKGNYTGTKSFPFSIKGNLEETDKTEVTIPDQTYTGSSIEPVNMAVRFNGTVLRKGTDYTVAFTGTEPGLGEAVIQGINNYQGTVRTGFNIVKKNLDDVTDSSRDFVISGIDPAGYEYNGYPIEPAISIDYNGMVPAPAPDTDYTLEYNNSHKAGEASVTITGIGDHFEGSTQKTYQIHRYDIGKVSSAVTLSGVVEDIVMEDIASTSGVALTDDGAVIQTDLAVHFQCTNGGVPEDRVLDEGEDRDYTVSYERNTEIGTATVIITGQGNFTGTIRKDFKIRGDLNANGNLQIQNRWTYVPEIGGVCQNTPQPAVRYNGELLTARTDYTVAYTFNDNVGTATVTITANPEGNYTGSLNTTFEITKRLLSLEDEELVITGLEEAGYEYNGTGILPALTVTYMGVELDTDDIEITAEHNVNVPAEDAEVQPVVRITAKADGNYDGTVEIPFVINPRPVSEESIRVEGIAYGYDYNGGNEVKVPEGELQIYYREEDIPLDAEDYDATYTRNREIGTAVITFTGKGNYAGSFEKNFYVMGDLNADYMEIAEIEPVPYGIVAVYPTLVITDNSLGEVKILELNRDYEITDCINNINVAAKDSPDPPTVTIQGIGCYKGSFSETFDIIPKNLSEDEGDITASFAGSINNEEVSDAFIYTGSEITPAVTVYNHGVEMASGIDYVVRDYVNNTNVPDPDAPEDMRPGVIIDAVENGNYLGTKIIRFHIIPKDIDDVDIEFTGENTFTYDRQEKRPEVAVTYTEEGETHDFPSDNYGISYAHNIDAGSPADGDSAPAVIITGKGNFTGTRVKPFTILPEAIDAENTDITATADSVVYTGSRVTTTVTLTAADGTVLGEEDFTVGSYTSNLDAGTAFAEVQGLGNYCGTRSVAFTITPKPIGEDITVSEIEPQEYTAAAIEPEPAVAVGTGDSAVTLVKGTDYELSWNSHINAGTGYVIITGKNNYGDSIQVPFTIKKKSIGMDGIMDGAMTLQDVANQQYTGGLVKPGISLAYQGGVTQPLLEKRDYTLTYTGNVGVGTATILISGINNFEGTIQTSFRIQGNLASASVAQIPVQPYTGAEVKPLPTVILAGKTLVKDTDYEVSYLGNVERGTATITITGTGDWYIGTKTINFVIAREFSSQMKIKMESPFTYTGKAITPSVRVEDYGGVLTLNEHYKLSYSSNVNAGTAQVIVTGIGEYSGSRTAAYKIIERNIAQCAVANISNQNYTGKKISPGVKVTYGGRTLTAGKDYTVVYTNNLKAGRAKAIIKGKGNFIGTKTIGYNIVIPKVSSVKGSSSTSSIKISWKKNNNVTGYEIYTSSNKLVKRLGKTKTSHTITKLKPGKTYTYKIRAYAVKDGAAKRSSFVTLKICTKPAAASITSIRSSKSKQVVLKWKKVSGATDYIIYRSTSKKGTYKSIGTTKNTYFTDKKATGGKTYYYKVRVRRTVDKKNYYSSYSAVKSVKAKK